MIAATILVAILGLFLLFLFAGTGSETRRDPYFTGFGLIWVLSAGISIAFLVLLAKLIFAAIEYLNRH